MVRRRLDYRVKEAYYQLVYVKKAIAITEGNLRLLSDIEGVAQTRFRAGGAMTGVALAVMTFLAGLWLGGRTGTGAAPVPAAAAEVWTCPMHPQIRMPEPGLCPLCGMALVRQESLAGLIGPRQVHMSAEAVALAEIEVAPVTRRYPVVEVRMAGKVEYDETRLSYITSRVPGRLDRLYVDYTGVPVKEGDHLVDLYSPELLTAQQELLQALQTRDALRQSPDALIRERSAVTVASARDKLRLWGLTPGQIAGIEAGSEPNDHLVMYAPTAGIVIHKDAVEGMYVQTGTTIYTIADLSEVWVKLDAYESDLPWIHYGQEVRFETGAYAGQSFTGRVSFIDPTLNPKTRTVKIRVNVANPDGLLKPEMFVRAVLTARIAGEGKVIDPSLAGKWISPMHPEIIKDGPGQCDICGMDLVPAADLGYLAGDASGAPPPLMIPATAPLITGKRAVVYVADTNQPGTFQGRDVVLGPRATDAYIVREGLAEGELVVVHGNFKIDSEIQIHAGPSMMSPNRPGGDVPPTHVHDHDHAVPPATSGAPQAVPLSFQAGFGKLLQAYLELQSTLARDDGEGAARHAGNVASALEAVDATGLSPEAEAVWHPLHAAMQDTLQTMVQSPDLARQRPPFETLSESMLGGIHGLSTAGTGDVNVIRCPMAFGPGKAARWLQEGDAVRNPYRGAEMLECGILVERIPAPKTEESQP